MVNHYINPKHPNKETHGEVYITDLGNNDMVINTQPIEDYIGLNGLAGTSEFIYSIMKLYSGEAKSVEDAAGQMYEGITQRDPANKTILDDISKRIDTTNLDESIADIMLFLKCLHKISWDMYQHGKNEKPTYEQISIVREMVRRYMNYYKTIDHSVKGVKIKPNTIIPYSNINNTAFMSQPDTLYSIRAVERNVADIEEAYAAESNPDFMDMDSSAHSEDYTEDAYYYVVVNLVNNKMYTWTKHYGQTE